MASTAFAVKADQDAMHARHDLQNQSDAEKNTLAEQQASLDARSQAEAGSKMRKRTPGGTSTIATSPQGVLGFAPISKASLTGKTLLGQ